MKIDSRARELFTQKEETLEKKEIIDAIDKIKSYSNV
jgi:hypothetical protein